MYSFVSRFCFQLLHILHMKWEASETEGALKAACNFVSFRFDLSVYFFAQI